MKIPKAAAMFACGLVLGVSLTLCIGAAGDAPVPAKRDWSRLQTLPFGTGVLGFFDPDSGRIYMYDANLENCYSVRELKTLGAPMVRVRD